MFAGYNKHAAFNRIIHKGFKEEAVGALHSLWKALPQSRNNPLANKARQLLRFSEGMRLSSKDRYWRWAGYAHNDEAMALLHTDVKLKSAQQEFVKRRNTILQYIPDNAGINDILLTDMLLVLPNDMLTKVDLMSMANGLEVRVPFLDYEVVNFVFGLPGEYKINHQYRKRILQDAFRDILPAKLYNRPKKGFEVPLLKWFRNEMKSLITDDLLSEEYIRSQGIFEYSEVDKLKQQLFSSNPGDSHARIWGLVVFQWWWKKIM
jgi:asparagine synthase (glutamine-hydrolysing)